MARYLNFILDGEIPSVVRRSLARFANIHIEEGKTRVMIPGLPRSDLEEVLQRIAGTGLQRIACEFDIGEMPGHKDSVGERVVGYQLEAFDVNLPSHPVEDFIEPVPDFIGCAWLKPDRILRIPRKPLGHMAGIGTQIIFDDKLVDVLKSITGSDITLKGVSWRGKEIPWYRIQDVPIMTVLDKNLVFNPIVRCPNCGSQLIPLRSTLIAQKDVYLKEERFVQNSEGQMHEGKEPIFILSPKSSDRLRARLRSGYILKPIYASDSPISEYLKKVEETLDKYIPGKF